MIAPTGALWWSLPLRRRHLTTPLPDTLAIAAGERIKAAKDIARFGLNRWNNSRAAQASNVRIRMTDGNRQKMVQAVVASRRFIEAADVVGWFRAVYRAMRRMTVGSEVLGSRQETVLSP